MLAGTVYEALTGQILPPTPENIAFTELDNYNELRYWGRIMQVRNSLNQNIETPGLVVLEIPEEFVDEDSMEPFPGLVYWVVAGNEIYEVPDFLSNEMRLGACLGIIDADFFASTDLGEEVLLSETMAPVDKLISFGALKNPEKTRERLELHNMEISILNENS